MKINVPLIAETDCLIVGGTVAACRLAVALRRNFRSVYCVTPYSYFGEDICAGLELDIKKISSLLEFGFSLSNINPAGAKQLLDSALISAGVEYLYENQPVAPMYDESGHVRGCLFAGRSGFFAIAAKTVVNALKHNILGATVEKSGSCTVELHALGGVSASNFDRAELVAEGKYPHWRVEKQYQLKSGSVAELSQIDLEMRTRIWSPETLRIADECIWHFAQKPVYQPASKAFPVFADSADAAEVAAMVEANELGTKWSFREKAGDTALDAVSVDTLFRWRDCRTVPFELNSLPADAAYDVLVCGAGTGGAPAAIAAGRSGAKTLCVEKLSIPGGICTAGRIGTYWFGNCCGFTAEIDYGIGDMAPIENYVPLKGHSPMERKSAWLTRELKNAGCEVRFNTFTVGALRDGHKVCGAILAGPWGVQLVEAKVSVDASGNADLAAAAGAPTRPLVEGEPAVQGTGLPPYELDRPGFNSDYMFVCDCDVVDATAAFTMAHDKWAGHFDVAQILDTRERRRILGEIELQPMDFFAHRQYSDTVVIARSNFDTHGFVCHPMFLLKPTEHDPYFAKVPYRSLLPLGWEGVLVTGLGISAHRDCMPLVRMQPDVQNQGYAAGLAAAMAAESGKSLREIPVRKLQEKLVEIKILPPEILTEEDSFGGFDNDDSHLELASAFLEPGKAVEKALRDFASNPTPETAALLAFLGNDAGRKLLEDTIAASAWDSGWEYHGMGQFGRCAGKLDVLIMALARIGSRTAAVRVKAEQLSPVAEFSHFRAICLYFMAHPCPEAAKPLQDLLASKGFSGHSFQNLRDVLNGVRGSSIDTTVRNAQLKELYVAKALSACDPDSALATEILGQYRNSMQTYYQLFAAR